MHVGKHRNADLAFYFGQHLQAFFQSRTAEAGAGSAVGFIETRFEDEGNAERIGDFLQLSGHIQLQLHGLDHARAGNQEETLIQTYIEAAQFHEQYP